MLRPRRKGKRLLTSFFLTYFIVLIIPVSLALMFYNESMRIVQQDIERENRGLITQASEMLDTRIKEIRNIGTQLISSSQVVNLSYVDDPLGAQNAGQVINARNSLTKYTVYNDFIFDYALFFNHGQFFINDRAIYSYPEFYSLYMRPDSTPYEQWLEDTLHASPAFGQSQARSIYYMNTDTPGPVDLVEFSYSFLPYHSNLGRAVVYVEQSRLLDLLPIELLENGGCVLIANSSGEPLTSYTSSDVDVSMLQQALQSITENYASLTCTLGSTPMLLMQATSAETGYRIAIALPESVVNARVRSLHAIVLGTLFAALLLGSWLCYYNARRNTHLLHAIALTDGDRLLQMSYSNALRSLQASFASIQSANESMLHTMEQQKPYLLYTFIFRLVRGEFRTENEALALAKTLGSFDHFGTMRAVLFRLNSGISSGDAISLQLRTSCKAAIKLAMDSTLANPLYLDVTDDEIVLLAYGPTAEQDVQTLVAQIRSTLPQDVNNMLFVYVGNAVEELTNVVRSYDNATSLIYIQPDPSVMPVVFFDQVEPQKQTLFYPQDIQHHLINCTLNGDEEGLINLLSMIKERNLQQTQLPIFMQQLLIDNLLNTLLQANSLSALPPEVAEVICDSIRELMALPLEKQIQQVDQLYLQLCQEVCRQKSGKQQNLIHQVMQYIQSHYDNSELSLTHVADRFHVSESYLSYTFKIQSGVNFVSYVENLRMTKAKELLRQTSLKIGDIALSVGYSSTNSFCRAFKRSTGDSASSYRSGTE